jgi:hypothetical protein
MKLGDNTIRDLDIDSLVNIFPISTEAGKQALRERLQSPTSETAILIERQTEVKALRSLCKANRAAIEAATATLKECEADVVSVGDATSDKRLLEYYTQILWASDSMAAPLNHMGWLTELVVLFRTILLPGLTVILPLFVLIAPFLLFNFILKQELTVTGYFDLLQGSIKKSHAFGPGCAPVRRQGGLSGNWRAVCACGRSLCNVRLLGLESDLFRTLYARDSSGYAKAR